jgi:hypothetical protein
MVPISETVSVEVIVGVPDALMVTGTSELTYPMQLVVVKEKTDEVGTAPQLLLPDTLQ